MKNHHVYFVLVAQFYPITTMSQPPCIDIEYRRSYMATSSWKLQMVRLQISYIVSSIKKTELLFLTINIIIISVYHIMCGGWIFLNLLLASRSS